MSYFSTTPKSLEDLPTLEGEASKPIMPDIRYHTEAPLWGQLMNEQEATYRINGFAVPESVYRAVTAWYMRAWELAKKLEEGTEAETARIREHLLEQIQAVEREAEERNNQYDKLTRDVKKLNDILLSLRMSNTADQDGDCVLCDGIGIEREGYHTLNCPWSRAYMYLKKGDKSAHVRIMRKGWRTINRKVTLHDGWPPRVIKVPYIRPEDSLEATPFGTRDFQLMGVDRCGIFVYEQEVEHE